MAKDVKRTRAEKPAKADVPTHDEVCPARWACERLILYVKTFESKLDPAKEVASGFAGGEAGVLRIEEIGYFEPDLVTFYGWGEDGSRMQVVQHVNQMNVVLRATPRESETEEPQRIGFRLEPDQKKD